MARKILVALHLQVVRSCLTTGVQACTQADNIESEKIIS